MWGSRIIMMSVGLGLLTASTAALARPPKSCAWKFVGSWIHHGMGMSNKIRLTADGRAICSGNIACGKGTWTCSGNKEIYSNGLYSTVYTLRPNGTMTARGGALVVTRVGAHPRTRRAVGTAHFKHAAISDKTESIKTPSSSRGSTHIRVKQEMLDVFAELAASGVSSWKVKSARDIVLKRRIVGLRDSIGRDAARGRWLDVQKGLPILKKLMSELNTRKR